MIWRIIPEIIDLVYLRCQASQKRVSNKRNENMSNGISRLGADVVARNLLKRSKAGKEGSESAESKINKGSYKNRVYCVRSCLNSYGGPTLAAAKAIKGSFFTDVDDDVLEGWLTEEVEAVRKMAVCPLVGEDEGEPWQGNLVFDPSQKYEECEDEEEDAEEEDEDEGVGG